MPKGGKLSNLGLNYEAFMKEAKNNLSSNIRHKADECGFSENEIAAMLEYCEVGLWNRDKDKDTKSIIVDICNEFGVSEERFSEFFHLVFPLKKDKK